MKPPFLLIPDLVSNKTVECLEALLEHAREGEVIGIAFAAALKRRAFITNSAGECFRSPTFTRGMVAALKDQLAQRIRGGNP